MDFILVKKWELQITIYICAYALSFLVVDF